MLNNNHYLVVTTTEIKEEKEKHYSYMMKVPGSNNVWSMLKSIPNIVSANICDTKKAAGQLVEHWNDCYKKNGTYLFDETFRRFNNANSNIKRYGRGQR